MHVLVLVPHSLERTNTHTHVHTHTCTHAHTHTHIDTHAHTHTFTHTLKYTHTQAVWAAAGAAAAIWSSWAGVRASNLCIFYLLGQFDVKLSLFFGSVLSLSLALLPRALALAAIVWSFSLCHQASLSARMSYVAHVRVLSVCLSISISLTNLHTRSLPPSFFPSHAQVADQYGQASAAWGQGAQAQTAQPQASAGWAQAAQTQQTPQTPQTPQQTQMQQMQQMMLMQQGFGAGGGAGTKRTASMYDPSHQQPRF